MRGGTAPLRVLIPSRSAAGATRRTCGTTLGVRGLPEPGVGVQTWVKAGDLISKGRAPTRVKIATSSSTRTQGVSPPRRASMKWVLKAVCGQRVVCEPVSHAGTRLFEGHGQVRHAEELVLGCHG